MHSKPTLYCDCGKEVTANTLKIHMSSRKCAASTEFKKFAHKILIMHSLYKRAWLKDKGTEATIVSHWATRVLNKELLLESLSFKSPRPIGSMTPSRIAQMKLDRIGTNNPMSRPNIYGNYQLINYVKEICAHYLSLDKSKWDKGLIPHCRDEMNYKYPEWSIGVIFEDGKIKGMAKHAIVAYILRTYFPDLYKMVSVVRGYLISVGQKNSKKCIDSARESAIKNGQKRTTKAQIRLFELIKQFDPDAVLEFRIDNKLFDIYSPKWNTMIEMHGSIWHDINLAPKSLKDKVNKNIENDKIKELLAKSRGYNLWVFWDNQEKDWLSQLNSRRNKNETIKN